MHTPALSSENRLGPYRLLRLLGEGGMGSVHLGFDEALQRQVAIKVLHADATGRVSPTLTKRFLREARSAARINHPHVVTIYAVQQAGDGGGRPYIVMEYVEGGSLAERVRREGPLEWRTAARAVADALAGLAAAHERGVIHRDIKPANLMCGRDPHGQEITKLVDFGLARVLSGPLGDGDLTFTGAFVGSPSYCSPEQAQGGAVDARSDLYSLAATWYALLTGQPPFVADDPLDVLEHHLREPFPDVRLLSPAVPEQVAQVIARASRKKPAERYASADALRSAVMELLALPADITPSVLPARVARRIRSAPPPPPELSRAEDSIIELESRLARARSDPSTQLAALRSLYGLYSQLDRRAEAARAFRQALALHIKLHAPPGAGAS